tara:strand:+ start:2640 stop:3896 length:1257 start_codon:yes stop_codon:yes gene_type:complete
VQPFFSILIPFYNAEKTLNNCLKSIISQNFKKSLYEIILVNDNSKDNSEKKIKNLLKKNKQALLIKNNKNYGVSISRNTGIKKSKGVYIIFLDSDDLLKKNSLNLIHRYLKKSDVDFLYSNSAFKQKFKFINKNKGIKSINSLKKFNTYCWNFVVKNSFLKKNNIKFNNTKIFEDQFFVARLLSNYNKAIFVKTEFHKHNQYHDSLSRNTNYDSAMSCVKSIFDLINYKAHEISFNDGKIFFNNRINFIYGNLKNYLLVLKFKEIQKISKEITKRININEKNLQKFKLFNKSNNYFILKKFVEEKRYFLTQQILKPLKSKKFSSLFIFCFGNQSRFLSRILKINNIKINGFLDNNFNLWGKRFHNINVYKPDILKNKKYKNSLLIIGHNDTKIINMIYKQLTNYQIKKVNIKKINFNI